MKSFFALITLSLVLAGCEPSKQYKLAQSFEAALEAGTGTSWSIVKGRTAEGQYSVFKNDTTGEYVAYNLAKWDTATMTNLDQYNAVALASDRVGNLSREVEWHYDTFTEDYDSEYFYVGGGFRFNTTINASRDLETFASLREEAAVAFLSRRFKSEFSLSENRAQEMARLASRYRRLENSRELTTAEKNTFAMSALGVNMNQVERALRQRAEGNEVSYQDMLRTAARVNSTTPEQIGKFFDEVVGEI